MPALFVPPIGLAWPVVKSPKYATRIQRSVSGRISRILDQPVPIWTWTLPFEFMRDKNDKRVATTIFDELRAEMGFFLAQQGGFGTFLLDDPTDDIIAAQPIGTGDGGKTQFQLVRSMPINGFNEPILAPNVVSHVYNNGVDAGGWTVNSNTGIITYSVAPAAGHIITADFTYYFRVRFADDSLDFENFMVNLWSVKALKLESVLL